MKWIDINTEKPKPLQDILAKFKYGIISCNYQPDKHGQDIGYIYMWEDKEFLIREWMPIEIFNEWADK